jgi:glycosyltransferase involved in cell wall biosynthesis
MDVYPDIATDLGVLAQNGIPARLIGAASDWSRRKADGIIVLGEDMKARLLARGIAADKIHIAENWADGAEIVPLPFPEGPLVIHYSGNLGLAHEIETIIGALRNIGNDDRFRFIFAGGGARRARLQDFCRESGLRNVEFQPYTSRAELGASLASGHLGLVTQLPETCGSVVPSKTYGIMAAGRPLLYIGPRGATPSRIIAAHGCGWHIDPGDVAGLTGLLTRLAAERYSVFEAGARARAAFEQHYDRPIGISRIAAILGCDTAFTGLH